MKKRRELKIGRYKLNLGNKTCVMGIINRTPDSFSDGGLFLDDDACLEKVIQFAEEGADIIDIGGESTRPGAPAVSEKEEIRRTIPIIRKIRKIVKLPISIDTTKSKVAKLALQEGAVIVNDISGLRKDPRMTKVIARYKAAVIIMHSQGTPRNMQKNPRYKDLIPEIISSLRKSINKAVDSGVDPKKIIIDPGIGFGKTTQHNLQILKNLEDFKVLEKPIMVGPSRKSFIGNVLGVPADQRIFGTSASISWAIGKGANIVRVHDVKEMSQVTRVIDAIKSS